MTDADRDGAASRRSPRPPALAMRHLCTGALVTKAGAGLAAALLAIAYCLSFSALLFQGGLHQGLAMGLWALLAGSAVTGLVIGLTSSLAPVAAGPNNPAMAVLSLLAATIGGAVLSAGGSPDVAVGSVLISFALATLGTGLVLFGLGAARLGQYVRFVPYPVIGGFLAASGWLLASGGIKVVAGPALVSPDPMSGLIESAPRLAVAIAFAAVVHLANRATGRMNALPVVFVAATLVIDAVLWLAGGRAGDSFDAWYLGGTSAPAGWQPALLLAGAGVAWPVVLADAPEIASAAVVTVVALLLDVSSLEVARGRPADLDR